MTLLALEKLTIRFGGIQALLDMQLRIEKEGILAIIGPNGSGKTTIFNCISGVYHPDSGKILFEHEDLQGLSLEIREKEVFAVLGLNEAGKTSRESFTQAMMDLKDFRPEGMGGPITFGPKRHHGLNAIRMAHAEEGKHVPVTDYIIFEPLF